MTAVAERPAAAAPGQTAADRAGGRRIDAVTVLSIYTFLLIAIPAALVVAPLGAVGGPATIFAALVLVFYLVTWLHPALAPAHGRMAVRAAAILLTCAIIATYVSANRHAMPGLERNGIDRGIILICGWLGVLVMAADGIPSIERLKKLLGRAVIGATAMAMLGITQFFTGLDATQYIVIPGLRPQTLNTDLLSRNGLNRPSATAAHPLEFAAVLGMVLPIAINRARFAPPGKRLQRWLQVALIGAAMPMTVSRSAVLAVVAVCLVLLPTWPKLERRIAYAVLALGVTSLWFLVPGLVGTFSGLFATLSGDTSTTSRTSAYGTAAPYISQHPWFGHGFNTFFPASYFFTDDQYLLSLIEIGVIGLLALLALFITGLVTAQRIRRATTDPEMRDLGQSLTATIVVSMVAFGTFDTLSFNMAAGLTFMFLGCTGAALRLVRAQAAQPGGQLAGRAAVQPDQEPPALTHRPDPGPPDALAAIGVLPGTHPGQPNGHLTAPADRQPEQPSEQASEHLPEPAAKRPEQPSEQAAEPHQEARAAAQAEGLADKYLGERADGQEDQADGQQERQADGHLAEPLEARPEQLAAAGAEPSAKPPGEHQPWPWESQEQAAEARREEPAGAQAKPPGEHQPWPWESQEQAAAPRPEEQAAGPRPEEQAADARAEEPAGAQMEPPDARVEPPAAQVEQPTAEAEKPTAQAEQPAAQAEQPAAQAEQPAAQVEQPDAQAERPAEASWDAWRKAEQPGDQPAAATTDQQAEDPAGQPEAGPAEPPAERPAEASWDAWRQAEQPGDQPRRRPPMSKPKNRPASQRPGPRSHRRNSPMTGRRLCPRLSQRRPRLSQRRRPPMSKRKSRPASQRPSPPVAARKNRRYRSPSSGTEPAPGPATRAGQRRRHRARRRHLRRPRPNLVHHSWPGRGPGRPACPRHLPPARRAPGPGGLTPRGHRTRSAWPSWVPGKNMARPAVRGGPHGLPG